MPRKIVKVDRGPIDASERLRMPYARMLVPEEDGSYRAEILEFPGCLAIGDDAAEALSELEAVAEDWIDAAIEMGTPIPPPLEEASYSGKLNVRLPKSLHRKASLAAEFDGVSLNQLMVTAIAEYVGQKSSERVHTAGQILWPGTIQMVPMWSEQKSIRGGHQLIPALHSFETKSTFLQGA